jgi:transposase
MNRRIEALFYEPDKTIAVHLSAVERLQFHQQLSGPVMDQLHKWLEAQFALKQVEPNSGLGKAITYLLRHWKGLTISATSRW